MKQDDSNAKKQEEEVIEDTGELDETLDEVVELKLKVEEGEQKFRRALADYQNLEKRVQAQRRELILSANRDLLLRILPILDTLQLAYQHVQDKGLELSIKQFTDMLVNEGIVKIETKGKTFDPSIMEGISTAGGEENKVIEEVRAGYMLNDSLLRSAQVIVGSAEEQNGEKEKN